MGCRLVLSQIVNISNPESIKSITVLKNANDIAIYVLGDRVVLF